MNANKFKQARINSGLSTKDACEKLGIKRIYLYQIECGFRNPSRKLINKMLDLYQCKYEVLR